MQKMSFIFKSDDKIVLEGESYYDEENKIFFLETADATFEIELGEVFKFRRSLKDSKFVLISRGQVSKSQVILEDMNVTCDIEVMEFSRERKGESEIIRYRLESDQESVKTIILTNGSLSS